MRVFFWLSAISLILSNNLFAQESKLTPFKINGNINADTGTVQLYLIADTCYYPKSVQKIIAKVENKKFYFNGQIPFPQAFLLVYGRGYASNIFVIEPGTQSITCNIDSNRETPKVDNKVMKDYYGNYTNTFKEVVQKRNLFDKKWDNLNKAYQNKIPDSIKLSLETQLKELYNESDKTLLKYVTEHPNSYVGFWKFIHLNNFGYEKNFDLIFSHFSDLLKNTYAGKVLAGKLKTASVLAIGNKFPNIISVNNHNIKLDTNFYRKNKYTLVDLWYSHCGPCIAQFPDLKELYEEYKSKGFDIIGISTDQTNYRKDWQNIINKYQLLWPQYWDMNGQESAKLSINAFPSSFLLDNQGNIIKKDIRPVELAKFLLENIK